MRAGKLRNCLGFTLFFLTRHSLLATSQASHSTALGRNTVLEPAHYHTETISASTREEDLAQHVQAGTETSTTTASQHTQDSPHMITKSAEMAAAIATDEILHQTATTKGHWGEKNTTAGSSSGTYRPENFSIVSFSVWKGKPCAIVAFPIALIPLHTCPPPIQIGIQNFFHSYFISICLSIKISSKSASASIDTDLHGL